MVELTELQTSPTRMSASAVGAGEDFTDAAAALDVTGYIMIWIDRDGAVHSRCSFLRVLEIIGAVESAKQVLWDASNGQG